MRLSSLVTTSLSLKCFTNLHQNIFGPIIFQNTYFSHFAQCAMPHWASRCFCVYKVALCAVKNSRGVISFPGKTQNWFNIKFQICGCLIFNFIRVLNIPWNVLESTCKILGPAVIDSEMKKIIGNKSKHTKEKDELSTKVLYR